MTEEHWKYIIDHFCISTYYEKLNKTFNSDWKVEYENIVCWNITKAETFNSLVELSTTYYSISVSFKNVPWKEYGVLSHLPSKELAEEIIHHIKETEILFI